MAVLCKVIFCLHGLEHQCPSGPLSGVLKMTPLGARGAFSPCRDRIIDYDTSHFIIKLACRIYSFLIGTVRAETEVWK